MILGGERHVRYRVRDPFQFAIAKNGHNLQPAADTARPADRADLDSGKRRLRRRRRPLPVTACQSATPGCRASSPCRRGSRRFPNREIRQRRSATPRAGACAAKFCSSAICFSVNARTSFRPATMPPSRVLSLRSGTYSIVRIPARSTAVLHLSRCSANRIVSGGAGDCPTSSAISGIWK
jgi:hypothetical protein